MAKVDIDTKAIAAQLQEDAGDLKVKVKLDRTLDVASSIRQMDKLISIRLNPRRIRTLEKLDRHLAFCREYTSGG